MCALTWERGGSHQLPRSGLTGMRWNVARCARSRFLTLSGAHFSGASTPDMIVTIWIFGVADYESEVRFIKIKMADPIWRSKFSKKRQFNTKLRL